jgi:hypothetical protein
LAHVPQTIVGVLIVETSSFGVFFEQEEMSSAMITMAAAIPDSRLSG